LLPDHPALAVHDLVFTHDNVAAPPLLTFAGFAVNDKVGDGTNAYVAAGKERNNMVPNITVEPKVLVTLRRDVISNIQYLLVC